MAISGPGTPYVTPAMLLAAPTGISWATIAGQGATTAAQTASAQNLCVAATAMVDSYCNTPLRSTIDTETLTGPDYRMTIRPDGSARVLLSRPPVTSVVSAQSTPSSVFPATWTTIPANMFRVDHPLVGVYGTSAPSSAGEGGQAVLLAPGYVSWLGGRHSMTLQVTYTNGWPHTSLTSSALSGATTIAVDDCTGWVGAAGAVYDSGVQESVAVTSASVTSGPGTLTLSAPLTNAHAAGVMVSALPGAVQWATVLFAVIQALTRGATATGVQTIPGARTGVGTSQKEIEEAAKRMLTPYRRVI